MPTSKKAHRHARKEREKDRSLLKRRRGGKQKRKKAFRTFSEKNPHPVALPKSWGRGGNVPTSATKILKTIGRGPMKGDYHP